jgi:hypothetical protein
MVLFGTVLFGIVLFGMVLFGIVLFGMVLFGMVLFGIVPCNPVSLPPPFSNWKAEGNNTAVVSSIAILFKQKYRDTFYRYRPALRGIV